MQKEPLRVLPIWVCLPGLPLLYWYEENLERIASFLGKSMCTDCLTAKGERISYARLLIEMDITQTLPEVVNVEESDDGIWNQKIEYEWKPILCHNVCSLDIIMSTVQNRSRKSKYPSEKQPNRINKQGRNDSLR